jgi:hypothetical protein
MIELEQLDPQRSGERSGNAGDVDADPLQSPQLARDQREASACTA